MHEVFTGIRVVKAYHTEGSEGEKFNKVNEGYFKSKRLRNRRLNAKRKEGARRPLFFYLLSTLTVLPSL